MTLNVVVEKTLTERSMRRLPSSLLRLFYGSILLIMILVGGNVMAEPKIELRTTGVPGIQLLRSDQIPDGVASAIKASDAAGILPYCVVVVNSGTEPITGLDVRYEVFTKADLVVKIFFYGSPDNIAGQTSYPVIGVGQIVVIGPIHAMNEQLMSSMALSLSSKQSFQMAQTLDVLAHADRIEISIDSAIRTDGVLRGPDRSATLWKFQRQVSEYKNFRQELLTRLQRNDALEHIKAWLIKQRDLEVRRQGKNKPLDRGLLLRKLLAQEYLGYTDMIDREQLIRKLELSPPEVRMHRIFKIRGDETE